MIFPRQLAKGSADIFGARLPRHSQQFVIILFRRRCHLCPAQTLAGAPTPAACAPATTTSSQFGRLLSSTSTYSASITSPGFFSCAPPAPAADPTPPPAPAS